MRRMILIMRIWHETCYFLTGELKYWGEKQKDRRSGAIVMNRSYRFIFERAAYLAAPWLLFVSLLLFFNHLIPGLFK